ncbi:MAG: hypothetical protein SGPRY_004177 [Prymnesium sp.]
MLGCALPTHWLSRESLDSLIKRSEEEGLNPNSIRLVVGRVVHVSGPFVAADISSGASEASLTTPYNLPAGANPYNLPAGETYFIVHAEMMLQHRWLSEAA